MSTLLNIAKQKASYENNTNTVSTSNDRNGDGNFQSLKKRKKSTKKKKFSYLSKNRDRRMRFCNAKDPIYFAFDCLENRSVVDLTIDFVKDSFFEVANFISKATK